MPHLLCFPFAQCLSIFSGHQAVSRTCPPLSISSDFIIREALKVWQTQERLSSHCCPAGTGSMVLSMLLSQEKPREMYLCFLLEHNLHMIGTIRKKNSSILLNEITQTKKEGNSPFKYLCKGVELLVRIFLSFWGLQVEIWKLPLTTVRIWAKRLQGSQ